MKEDPPTACPPKSLDMYAIVSSLFLTVSLGPERGTGLLSRTASLATTCVESSVRRWAGRGYENALNG